jgi:hypothetical protein
MRFLEQSLAQSRHLRSASCQAWCLRPAPYQEAQIQQKDSKTPSQPIKLGVMAHACHPNYAGGINRWIVVQASLVKK